LALLITAGKHSGLEQSRFSSEFSAYHPWCHSLTPGVVLQWVANLRSDAGSVIFRPDYRNFCGEENELH